MAFWEWILGRRRARPDRHDRGDRLIRNPALRDALARVADECSANRLLALYRTLLLTEQLFFVVTSGAEGRVGTFTVGPGDKLVTQSREIPEGGSGIVVYPDLRSAERSGDGDVASMPLRDAFRWAREARMGLVLTNLDSSHPTECDWLFIPPEHIDALATGEMPKV